jgi:hypothetical protein
VNDAEIDASRVLMQMLRLTESRLQCEAVGDYGMYRGTDNLAFALQLLNWSF